MSGRDPLRECLVALHREFRGSTPFLVAGGYGLYLKQRGILRSGVRTLVPAELLPDNRTTQDIDLFLRAEVVISADRMRAVRGVFDRLGFSPVPGGEYLQFTKVVEPAGAVKLDLLVGPMGDGFDPKTMKRDERRVRPRAFGGLHAHPVEEAVGIEEHSSTVSLDDPDRTAIAVPQPFTYLLMKLMAFRDRCNDERKDMARHHALDAYRIIAMITQDEDEIVRRLSETYRARPEVVEVRRVAERFFARHDSLGILRMREHPLFADHIDLDLFRRELLALLPPVGR